MRKKLVLDDTLAKNLANPSLPIDIGWG